jgi:hypothetical protein
MKQVLFVVAVMAQQDANLYLISWRSLISGEVDFYDRVLASSPEDAIKIASEGEFSELLELYDPEAEEM